MALGKELTQSHMLYDMNRIVATLLTLLLLTACQIGQPEIAAEPAALVRLTVSGTGLFKAERNDLAQVGYGTQTPLTLSLNGIELPYQWVDDTLYFYLPAATAQRYSAVQTLWITPEASVPATTEAAEAQTLETVTAETVLTANEQYSTNHAGDPWFWRTIVGPTDEPFTVPTPKRLDGDVTVTVVAGGTTEVPHRMTVKVNNAEVGMLAWDGTERKTETFTVTQTAGEDLNVVLSVPAGENGVDISMLDSITVRYPALPTARDGAFYGSSVQAGVVQVAGFEGSAVGWQVTADDMAALAVPEGGGFVVNADQEIVIQETRAAQAATVAVVESTALPTTGADYIAIVDPILRDTLQPLLDMHTADGLSVATFTPQQAYDAYSFGAVDPLAFRALLQDAQANWEVKPRFMLLVGDSTYDPFGYLNELPPTYVPSPFIDTVYGGETISDNLIADLDEDGYPDVALGRLPARTPAQLETIVNKILAYSQNPAEGEWRQRVLFAADGREDLFKDTSERLRQNNVPGTMQTPTVYPAAASDALTEMIPQLNEGSLIVNYVGHGSVQQWGRDKLLTTEAIPELTNGGRLPFYINMTCLVGLFSHPTQESLSEALLWSKSGGAIAVLAPTSLTLPTAQGQLNSTLLDLLLGPEPMTIGEALDEAKRAVRLTTSNERDIVQTFNLMGDPAMRLAVIR